MSGRKRSLILPVAVCTALVVAWLLSTSSRPDLVEGSRPGFIPMPLTETEVAPQTEVARYMVEVRIRAEPSDIVTVDRSVQFTFSGDHRISPGSLGKMTSQMHHDEIEIATSLGRDIQFPSPP